MLNNFVVHFDTWCWDLIENWHEMRVVRSNTLKTFHSLSSESHCSVGENISHLWLYSFTFLITRHDDVLIILFECSKWSWRVSCHAEDRLWEFRARLYEMILFWQLLFYTCLYPFLILVRALRSTIFLFGELAWQLESFSVRARRPPAAYNSGVFSSPMCVWWTGWGFLARGVGPLWCLEAASEWDWWGSRPPPPPSCPTMSPPRADTARTPPNTLACQNSPCARATQLRPSIRACLSLS